MLEENGETVFKAKVDLTEANQQLEKAKADNRLKRLIESLAEKSQTISDRILNYDSAVDNSDLIRAELDKTEQKITHICEVGMTSTDATDLSARIDGLTTSIATSERAIEGLDLADILGDDLSPPSPHRCRRDRDHQLGQQRGRDELVGLSTGPLDLERKSLRQTGATAPRG